jgi:hypothetical protein
MENLFIKRMKKFKIWSIYLLITYPKEIIYLGIKWSISKLEFSKINFENEKKKLSISAKVGGENLSNIITN